MSSPASTKGPSLTATSLVEAMPQPTIVTTTLFTSSSAAPDATSGHSSGSDVPIAAIAGGAAAGVVLAVAAVLVWHWWGRSIRRKELEKRKQAFAFFQVRENTRRNASSAGKNYTSYRRDPSANRERKVQFAGGHKRTMSKDSGISISEKETPVVTETPATPSPAPPSPSPVIIRMLKNTPARPSPLARSLTPPGASSPPLTSPTEPSEPLLPPRLAATRSNTDTSDSTAAARLSATLGIPQLNHKSSNASSVSVYSTQSGEERIARVPPSLIMAAFSRPDPAHPVIAEYTPAARLSAAEYDEQNRLSRASQTSASSQAEGGVGYAR